MPSRLELSASADFPGLRNPLLDILEKILRPLQGLRIKSVTCFNQENVDFCSTYRKVAASVVTLVVNEVGKSASPASRDWEQLFREEGVTQRLVEEGRRGRGARPLRRWSVQYQWKV